MSDIRNILKVAAGRLAFSAYLVRLHHVGLVVAGLVLLAIAVAKLTPAFVVPWIWAGPSLAALTLGVAGLIWLRHRRSDIQVAVAVDDRLDLREKLSTALHVAERDDAFARAAIEDAVTVSRSSRTREEVRRRFRVEAPNRWWISPVLLLIAVLAAALVPQGDIFASSEEETEQRPAVPIAVQNTLDMTVAQIKENPELADELKDVFQDLDPSSIDPEALKTPESARREAIKKLSKLSERLEELTDGEQGKTMEALKDAMSQLSMPQEDGIAKDMMEAMAKGDFKAAADKLKELKEQIENGELDPEQQEKIAKQLEEMAAEMAQLAQQQKALEEALKDAGMDPNLAQNPQQMQQAIEQNQNLNQQQKQQLQQMAQAQQAAAQMCQGMAGAMGQMAQGMMGQGQQGEGMNQMGQQLGQMEAMQQMLKQAQAMANKLKSQCQGLGQGLGTCQNGGMGQGGMGPKPGQGNGGEAQKTKTPIRTLAEKAESQQDNADIIANMLFDGPLIKGESTAAFRDAAMSAAESYAEEVSDDQIPRKYHDPMKHFYGELEASVEVLETSTATTEGGSQAASESGEESGE